MFQSDEELLATFKAFFPIKTKKELRNIYKNTLVDQRKSETGGGSISYIEFRQGINKRLKTFDGWLMDQQLMQIFQCLQNRGRLGLPDFVRGIRGCLGQYRQLIVDFVFTKLDKNESGLRTLS
jgi:hypothetical protein